MIARETWKSSIVIRHLYPRFANNTRLRCQRYVVCCWTADTWCTDKWRSMLGIYLVFRIAQFDSRACHFFSSFNFFAEVLFAPAQCKKLHNRRFAAVMSALGDCLLDVRRCLINLVQAFTVSFSTERWDVSSARTRALNYSSFEYLIWIIVISVFADVRRAFIVFGDYYPPLLVLRRLWRMFVRLFPELSLFVSIFSLGVEMLLWLTRYCQHSPEPVRWITPALNI